MVTVAVVTGSDDYSGCAAPILWPYIRALPVPQARSSLRQEGCRDVTWVDGGTAGEIAACSTCGALPYVSAVTCSCRLDFAPSHPVSSWRVQALQTGCKYHGIHVVPDAGHLGTQLAAVPCSPEQLRCLAHSHIGCTCSWQLKSLLQRLPDAELLQARRAMNDLAAKVQCLF